MALFFGQPRREPPRVVVLLCLENPLLGLRAAWLLIIATMDRFRRIDLTASLALGPLVLWVGFSAVLNFEIWRLT